MLDCQKIVKNNDSIAKVPFTNYFSVIESLENLFKILAVIPG